MITIYGMSDKYGMMQLEEVRNRYLGGNTSLTCSAETARDIDKEVARIIHEAHEKRHADYHRAQSRNGCGHCHPPEEGDHHRRRVYEAF